MQKSKKISDDISPKIVHHHHFVWKEKKMFGWAFKL